MITYLLVAFARYCARYYARYCALYYARYCARYYARYYARYCARSGWTVQRMLRVLPLNLFERRTLKQIVNPAPRHKKNEP